MLGIMGSNAEELTDGRVVGTELLLGLRRRCRVWLVDFEFEFFSLNGEFEDKRGLCIQARRWR